MKHQVPIGHLAGKLDIDQATATNAVKTALLGALQANATGPEGAATSVGALDQHGEPSRARGISSRPSS